MSAARDLLSQKLIAKNPRMKSARAGPIYTNQNTQKYVSLVYAAKKESEASKMDHVF